MTKVDEVSAFVTRRIASGSYGLGERLPSLRMLAEELGAHVNTVAQAYRQLADQGVVRSEQGRGTFVVSLPKARREGAAVLALEEALSSAFLRANSAGISSSEFLQLAESVAARQATTARPRIYFVECNSLDTNELADNISHVLNLRVNPLLVDTLTLSPTDYQRKADLVVTTPFHLEEVNDAIGVAAHVVSINVTPTARTLVELSRIPRHARVLVIGSNDRTIAQLEHLVEMHARRRPDGTRLATAKDLASASAGADVIVDSQSIHSEVTRHADTAAFVTVHFQLESASTEFLKARVSDLFPSMGHFQSQPA